jgi:soluble lytic murein transglycosylase-like protein
MIGRRLFWLALAAALAVPWPLSPASADLFPDRFDPEIRQAVRRWWPDYPYWRMLKAQLYQESRLDRMAVSRAGARGLGQFMPRTWDEMVRHLGLAPHVGPHDARAIEAAAFYMARLRREWRAPRADADRHDLAMASYNAGLGNLLKAQRACGGAASYRAIMACLPRVTGRHAEETQTYVARIHHWFQLMEAER